MSQPRDHDPAYNRDEDQKPPPEGGPPRSATEPAGSEQAPVSRKTRTDPASGEHRREGHGPNQAEADQVDGARPPGR